ncbi:hypothetical protein [Aeromicrobium sp. UC242_57]|uniref:hypothetical protein n=1 Tax=Aeromicrobium sp. UC242_57 TaxID=3374624 RepID=UPI00378992F5
MPLDGSKPTIRRTTFAVLVNGVAPSFLTSQGRYLGYPTVFARDYSAGAVPSANRPADRAVDAAAELDVAQILAEQRTCVVRAANNGFSYGRADKSFGAARRSATTLSSFFTRLAARTPGLVNVTWSPRKTSATTFISSPDRFSRLSVGPRHRSGRWIRDGHPGRQPRNLGLRRSACPGQDREPDRGRSVDAGPPPPRRGHQPRA